MKGASWGLKLELISSMMQMARMRKTKRKLVKPLPGKQDIIEDPTQDCVTRSKRIVMFDSQPQFEPSQGQDEADSAAAVFAQPKSILRRGTVKLQTVLYSPPVKSLEQHLVTVRDGNQEERFLQLREHEGGSSIKRQTSEKLKNKLCEIRNVKLNLSQRLGEISSPNQITPRSNMPTPALATCLTSTPITSPTLVEEVKTLSSIRQSSACRVLARRYQPTPFPHQVALERDVELSLTPTGSEKEGLDVLVTRKIEFDDGDSSGDEVNSGETDPPLKKQQNEADEYFGQLNPSPVLISSPEDMFASQESAQSIEDRAVVNISTDLTVTKQENVEAEDNVSNQSADEKLTLSTPQSVKTAVSERMVVMIPESSSDSSLAELSPLEMEENQDQLMDMFSDPEDKGGDQDEQEQEEDILTAIEDSDF